MTLCVFFSYTNALDQCNPRELLSFSIGIAAVLSRVLSLYNDHDLFCHGYGGSFATSIAVTENQRSNQDTLAKSGRRQIQQNKKYKIYGQNTDLRRKLPNNVSDDHQAYMVRMLYLYKKLW
jgi:hypothetical protein